MDTINTLLNEGALPRLEKRLLLEAAGGGDKMMQISQPDRRCSPQIVASYRQLCARRAAGEPIAYLLGTREFLGLELIVSPACLIPRPETELLVEWAAAHLPQRAHVLDLGTGSGAIAVGLAHLRADLEIWALDLSAEALKIAQTNAKKHGAKIQFLQSDWFSVWLDVSGGQNENAPHKKQETSSKNNKNVANKPQFDGIISNPPYLAADDPHLNQGDLRFEPQHALTDDADGLHAMAQICAQAPHFLEAGGFLAIEHGCEQGKHVRQILQHHGFHHINTHHDYASLERFTVAWRSTK